MKKLQPLLEDLPLLVVLLGAPGSGKGTHATTLSSSLQIPHISTGDLFRLQIRNRTKVGLLAQSYIDQGKLVPDEVVLEMLYMRLEDPDCQRGILLDGFPRTLIQAEMLEKKFGSTHQWVVLLLEADENLLVERICGRLVCQNCNAVFHKTFCPSKKGSLCDQCEGTLMQRNDDQESVVRQRLAVYHKQTKPLIEHYQEMEGVLRVVNASQSKDLVAKDILQEFALESSVH